MNSKTLTSKQILLCSKIDRQKNNIENTISKEGFEIICEVSNVKFDKMSDDFTYHLIYCESCLKKLLLLQAKNNKEKRQLLENGIINKKKFKIKNLNNSLTDHIINKSNLSNRNETENDSSLENSFSDEQLS